MSWMNLKATGLALDFSKQVSVTEPLAGVVVGSGRAIVACQHCLHCLAPRLWPATSKQTRADQSASSSGMDIAESTLNRFK